MSYHLVSAPLSSTEASFVLLGRVGSLEAGERLKESARGTLGTSSQVHLLFSPIHLPHSLGASAQERVSAPCFPNKSLLTEIFSMGRANYIVCKYNASFSIPRSYVQC